MEASDLFVLLIPVLGLGVVLVGAATIRRAREVAEFFRAGSQPMFGARASSGIYTERGLRVAGRWFVVLGGVTVALGLVALPGVFR